MKTNGSCEGGGSFKNEFFSIGAKYVCRCIKEYETRDYAVKRLFVQNEPKAAQTWDSCVYTPEEEKIFVSDCLCPEMKKDHLIHIEFFIWDHNKERTFERVCSNIDETADVTQAHFWYGLP